MRKKSPAAKPKLALGNDTKRSEPITFAEYQKAAKKTDFMSEVFGEPHFIAVRLADVTKNLRDVDFYWSNNEAKRHEAIEKFLGHVLWYSAILADSIKLGLDDIALKNIEGNAKRFKKDRLPTSYEIGIPKGQRLLPQREEFFFIDRTQSAGSTDVASASCYRKSHEGAFTRVGNGVNDNAADGDGYRFHDVLHMAYMVYLGWSPVMRQMLDRKRRSSVETDEFQDGARARDVEEALTSFVFAHAKPQSYFENNDKIDYQLLYAIELLVANFEVATRTMSHWNEALLHGFRIFRDLKRNKSGVVICDPVNRHMEYRTLPAVARRQILKEHAGKLPH